MGFITDIITNISAFRITIGNKLNTIKAWIGNLPSLTTTHKTDLVGAINEVNGKANNSSLRSWNTTLKYNTWSRLLVADTSASGISGVSYILNVKSTRGGFVVNFTFLITCTHAGGANAGNITQLSGNKYSGFKIRIVSNGYSNHYIEVFDDYNTGDAYFTYTATILKTDESALFNVYTIFNDGTTVPNGYHIDKSFQTIYRGVASEMFATQDFGSAEDWWGATQSVNNKVDKAGDTMIGYLYFTANLGLRLNNSQWGLVHDSNLGGINFVRYNFTDGVFFIKDNENIGVNTTNPLYKFDVIGNGRFTDNLIVPNATAPNHAVNLGQLNTKYTFPSGGNSNQYINGLGQLTVFPTIQTPNNGQLSFSVSSDFTGGAFTFGANQATNTTASQLQLSTAVKNDITKGVQANGWGNHADAGYVTTAVTGFRSGTNPYQQGLINLQAGANMTISQNSTTRVWTFSATDTNTITNIGANGVVGTSGNIDFTGTGGTEVVKVGNTLYISQSSLRTTFHTVTATSTLPNNERDKEVQCTNTTGIVLTLPNGHRNGQVIAVNINTVGGAGAVNFSGQLYYKGSNISTTGNARGVFVFTWDSSTSRWWMRGTV